MSKPLQHYKAALIGLGDIAWRYDAHHNDRLLTHLSTYRACPRIQVTGAYDPDASARDAFTQHTGIPVVDSLSALFSTPPDVISITSPTVFHAEHTEQCIAAGVPMIWLEKPAAHTVSALRQLIHTQHQHQHQGVLVGFQRRFSRVFNRLRENLEQHTFGTCQSISVTYSRGLLTNGIHLVDMVFYLLGDDPLQQLVVPPGQAGCDSPSFTLVFRSGVICQFTGLTLDYHSIDLSLHCTAGRVQVLHNGYTHRIERPAANPLFDGFRCLLPADDDTETQDDLIADQLTVSARLLDELIAAYEGHRPPISNPETALFSQQVVEEVLAECQ